MVYAACPSHPRHLHAEGDGKVWGITSFLCYAACGKAPCSCDAVRSTIARHTRPIPGILWQRAYEWERVVESSCSCAAVAGVPTRTAGPAASRLPLGAQPRHQRVELALSLTPRGLTAWREETPGVGLEYPFVLLAEAGKKAVVESKAIPAVAHATGADDHKVA